MFSNCEILQGQEHFIWVSGSCSSVTPSGRDGRGAVKAAKELLLCLGHMPWSGLHWMVWGLQSHLLGSVPTGCWTVASSAPLLLSVQNASCWKQPLMLHSCKKAVSRR